MTISTGPAANSDIAPGRLDDETLKANFADLHPPLDAARGQGRGRALLFLLRRAVPEGLSDLDRHSAVHPPDRHRQPRSAPRRRSSTPTSWAACARASARPRRCARKPACARQPRASRSRIGLLQRYATDALMATGKQPFSRGAPTGKQASRSSAAGPAGPRLRARACGRRPSTSTIFEAREKPGGLNEYGIAAYKTPDDFAAKEADFILSIGGIDGEARRRARPRHFARRTAPRL